MDWFAKGLGWLAICWMFACLMLLGQQMRSDLVEMVMVLLAGCCLIAAVLCVAAGVFSILGVAI